MACPHCHRLVCDECLRISKLSKKNPIFYDAVNRVYLSVPFVSNKQKLVIFDLHGVADLFTPAEFNSLASSILDAEVIILSYVGATTPTRQTAQDFISQLDPTIKGFLCFRRKGVSDKGSFVTSIGGDFKEILFLDDNSHNIETVTSACTERGVICKTVLVPPQGKDIILDSF